MAGIPKFQETNSKQIPKMKYQYSNELKSPFGYGRSEIIWNLDVGSWNFRGQGTTIVRAVRSSCCSAPAVNWLSSEKIFSE